MKIQITSDRDYQSLCKAMENILACKPVEALLTSEQYGTTLARALVRVAITEDAFLNAGREAIIHYLDNVSSPLTGEQIFWLEEQQDYIARKFSIIEGEDY